jgi:hypothetical protein
LLTTALNWIEAQIQPGQETTPLTLQRQLRECEPIAVATHHQFEQQNAVKICGPAGTYPLAVGLCLISTASGKPWGFAAAPEAWNDDEWSKLTAAIEFLYNQPLQYVTGDKQLHLAGVKIE